MYGEPTLDDLIKELKELRGRLASDARNLEYRLDNMDMKDIWQNEREDNVDATNPITFDLYIPPRTRLIQQVLLRLRLKQFRSYGTGAADGGAVVLTAAMDEVDYGSLAALSPIYQEFTGTHDHGGLTGLSGMHQHGITDGTVLMVDGGGTVTFYGAGGHNHEIPQQLGAYHYHQVYRHFHQVDIPAHQHDLVHGIYLGPTAADVGVIINGTDRTVALGGPFNSNQDELDITQYITTGWNTVQLTSSGLGRIHATMFTYVYLPG